MKPSEIYLDRVKRKELSEDKAQINVLKKLDVISDNLNKKKWNLFNYAPIKGIYIFGKVGRGKTQVMDIFYQSLKTNLKDRLHFHRFMKMLHDELANMEETIDPIYKVVKKISKKTSVLCFDEFFVEDIGDAMLLARFLKAAFESGITLISTSNIKPDKLYENGLHRKRFLPAINAINYYCDVHELISSQDYRLRTLTQLPMYILSDKTDSLEESFDALLGEDSQTSKPINILGRQIKIINRTEGILWIDFKELCRGPRSSKDYIELTIEFHTILVSNIPAFSEQNEDASRRFRALVDECYERNINLILSSEVELVKLYQGTNLAKPFERTVSRLTEMQSAEFLSKPHLP